MFSDERVHQFNTLHKVNYNDLNAFSWCLLKILISLTMGRLVCWQVVVLKLNDKAGLLAGGCVDVE
jgi:hypothetical protein